MATITQSFKVKKDDGSFSDVVLFSTTSDLVFDENGNSLTNNMADVNTKITTNQNAISSINTDISSINTDISSINTEITANQNAVNADISSINNAISEINDDENGILQQAKDYSDAVVAGVNSTLSEEIEKLQTTVGNLETEQENLSTRVATIESTLEDILTRLSVLEGTSTVV